METALPTQNLSGVATVLIEFEEDLAMLKRIIWVVHLLLLPFRKSSPREKGGGASANITHNRILVPPCMRGYPCANTSPDTLA